MSAQNKDTKQCANITVVIPVYNGDRYIEDCVKSLLTQTLKPSEIIIINDGSTDRTLEIINNMTSYGSIKIITIENSGQGKARNIGLDKSSGDYIMFLDADDIIEPETLELAYKAISKDASDFVIFNWQFYNEDTGEYKKADTAVSTDKKVLEGEECLLPLRKSPFFSVNKLYLRSFLNTHKIRYGEWRIYEDVPFWVKACVKARKISVIHKPLYTVRLNPYSTTRTRFDTDLHSNGYLLALKESLNALGNENNVQHMYIYSYFVSKFISYYNKRTPQGSKKAFLKGFVDLMNKSHPEYNKALYGALPYKLCIMLKVFENKRYIAMLLICKLTGFYRKFLS